MSYDPIRGMGNGVSLFINSFENSIGNINTPEYPKIVNVKGLSWVLMTVQLTMIWVIWFLNQYVILVIMLNFLIAVISDTYNKEQGRAKYHTYLYRNELNIEYLKMRGLFFPSNTVNCVLYVTDKERYEMETPEYDGFFDEVIATVKDSHVETR